jgi:hypothetical protein
MRIHILREYLVAIVILSLSSAYCLTDGGAARMNWKLEQSIACNLPVAELAFLGKAIAVSCRPDLHDAAIGPIRFRYTRRAGQVMLYSLHDKSLICRIRTSNRMVSPHLVNYQDSILVATESEVFRLNPDGSKQKVMDEGGDIAISSQAACFSPYRGKISVLNNDFRPNLQIGDSMSFASPISGARSEPWLANVRFGSGVEIWDTATGELISKIGGEPRRSCMIFYDNDRKFMMISDGIKLCRFSTADWSCSSVRDLGQ